MFIGRSAKMIDVEALKKAINMQSSGVDEDSIWRETGWFQSPFDNRWRAELDDSQVAWNESALSKVGASVIKLHEAVDAPLWFSAYPELRNVELSANFPAWVNDGNADRVKRDSIDEVLALVQGIIREIEGFASPSFGSGLLSHCFCLDIDKEARIKHETMTVDYAHLEILLCRYRWRHPERIVDGIVPYKNINKVVDYYEIDYHLKHEHSRCAESLSIAVGRRFLPKIYCDIFKERDANSRVTIKLPNEFSGWVVSSDERKGYGWTVAHELMFGAIQTVNGLQDIPREVWDFPTASGWTVAHEAVYSGARLPQDFDCWELVAFDGEGEFAGVYGATVAHVAAWKGSLPRGFDKWLLRDDAGQSVAREAWEAHGALPEWFNAWSSADESGWTVAHEAAKFGFLPEGFDQWELVDNSGQTVRDVFQQHPLKPSGE